jgi:twitching motility protein PilT
MDPADRLLGELALKHALLTREQIVDCGRRAQEEAGKRNLAEIARDLGWLSEGSVRELVERRDQLLAQRRRVPATSPQWAAGQPAPAPGTQALATAPTMMLPAQGAAAPAAAPASVRQPERVVIAEQEPPSTRGAESEVNDASPIDTRAARPSLAPAPAVIATHSRHVKPRTVVAQAVVGDPNVDDTTKPPYLLRALRYAVQHGASDLHLHSGAPIIARGMGRLLPFANQKPLSPEATEKAIAQVLTDEQWGRLATDGEVDFPLELPRIGRFRANAYRQHRGLDIVLRILRAEPPKLEQLGLPSTLERLVDFRTGLVLCTGPAGCGKSTTLAALVNVVVSTRRDHVLTIENPVEYVYRGGKSIVTQRQVGAHTTSFARALRAALREDPDVIAITELRDRETMGLALTAAETGHLVLGTLHTGNAGQTIGRIINAFPSDEQAQIRGTLAESLRAVVSQRLVPRADGAGRAVALEVLQVNTAVMNMIREEKEYQLGSLMQTGKSQGMVTLDDSLAELLASGTIDKAQARRFAENKERFK